MAILNDETVQVDTGVSSSGTTTAVEINTSDNGEDVSVFVDDNSGGAPADFTIVAERYSEAEDRWMRFGSDSVTGASDPQSFTDPAVPSRMRYQITNDSGGAADLRVSVVSY